MPSRMKSKVLLLASQSSIDSTGTRSAVRSVFKYLPNHYTVYAIAHEVEGLAIHTSHTIGITVHI